ncbi:hypothetical protein GCM10027578_24280 [Spirosoma luteolum]
MRPILFTALLLLWLLPLAFSQPVAPAVTQRIRQVETGLMPAVQLAGQPDQHYALADRMRHFRVPAVSIALVNNGQVEWARAYGFLSSDSTRPANAQTLFQAASISKPISAMGALKLVEQGKLHLDTAINRYLTSWQVPSSPFTAARPITLRGLLSHSAGLTVHGFSGYQAGRPVPTLVQILTGQPPANSPAVVSDTMPGLRWSYSGGGYVLLQQALEDVTGQPLATFMQQTVLAPLGMTHSTFEQPLPTSLTANAAIGHFANGRPIAGNWRTHPEQAAAGLWTTPSDLARYLIEVQQAYNNRSNRVLSSATTRTMMTPQVGDQGLGPGLDTTQGAFGHSGGNVGYRCLLYAFTPSGQGAVVMTNSDAGMDLVNEIFRSIAHTYHWPAYQPVRKTVMPLSAGQLTSLTGTYAGLGDRKPTLTITAVDGGLQVRQSWDNATFVLLPEATHQFFMRETGAPFTFTVDSRGAATSLLAFGRDRWTKLD